MSEDERGELGAALAVVGVLGAILIAITAISACVMFSHWTKLKGYEVCIAKVLDAEKCKEPGQ